MSEIVQHSVNIALLVAMLLVLAILLITCAWQRNKFTTRTPFIYMISFIMLFLADQVVNNVLELHGVSQGSDLMPIKVVYILDYLFSYSMTVAFYYYVEALVKNGYSATGTTYQSKRSVGVLLISWGVVTNAVYGVLLIISPTVRVDSGNTSLTVIGYFLLHIVAKLACIFTAVLIFRNRKVLPRHEAILSLAYLVSISVFVVVDELFGLCISYVIMALFAFVLYVRIDLYKELLLERQEKELVESKTQIMLSQMQPHFLYNVLTTISSMCEVQGATQARDVVNKFADYFRTNLDSLGRMKTIPFKKELEHIETYLWLEKVRFEDHLNVQYNIGPVDFEIPSLTVQPVVENAVKHGLQPKDEPGTITISTRESESEFVITVEDDGVGFDTSAKLSDSRTHVGLENVSKRLEAICSGFCDIASESGKGTTVTIHIPKGEVL